MEPYRGSHFLQRQSSQKPLWPLPVPGCGGWEWERAHLLLPPLQGGEVEDPEVSGDTPSGEPPQQIHGTTTSRHIGSRMEGAG